MKGGGKVECGGLQFKTRIFQVQEHNLYSTRGQGLFWKFRVVSIRAIQDIELDFNLY